MIAAWMVYATAITLLLCAGAAAAEYLARALGAPTRFVWVAAALLAVAMSGSALVTGTQSTRAPAVAIVPNHASSISIAVSPAGSRTTSSASRAGRTPPNAIHSLLTRVQRGVETVRLNARRLGGAHLDASRLERWNVVLIAVWFVGSTLAVAYLLLSFVSVLRIRRRHSEKSRREQGRRRLIESPVGQGHAGVERPPCVGAVGGFGDGEVVGVRLAEYGE